MWNKNFVNTTDVVLSTTHITKTRNAIVDVLMWCNKYLTSGDTDKLKSCKIMNPFVYHLDDTKGTIISFDTDGFTVEFHSDNMWITTIEYYCVNPINNHRDLTLDQITF